MPHALVDFKAAGTPEERHKRSFVMSEADLSHFKVGDIWATNRTVGTEYKRIAHINYLSMNVLTNDLLYTGGMANPSDILQIAIENGINVEEEVVASQMGSQESGLGAEELQHDADDGGAKEMVGYQKKFFSIKLTEICRSRPMLLSASSSGPRTLCR